MIRIFFLLSLSFLFFSCSKDNVGCSYTDSYAVATSSEIMYLQSYINNNAITATQHPSGIFYHIDSEGTVGSPVVCSTITVNYSGRLLSDGSVFDAKDGKAFVLGQLIQGWQKGLPLLKEGGAITLYIPPSLGYGANDVIQNNVVLIPANSYLKFTIQLLDVQ
ncbi:MAG: FKBP-type peptidyl-prolyl cis-trans isomerase [Ferruginibacter sp.]